MDAESKKLFASVAATLFAFVLLCGTARHVYDRQTANHCIMTYSRPQAYEVNHKEFTEQAIGGSLLYQAPGFWDVERLYRKYSLKLHMDMGEKRWWPFVNGLNDNRKKNRTPSPRPDYNEPPQVLNISSMQYHGIGAFIGQPVLYLHGNAGSWRQVRSVASEISRRSKTTETYFDFWAIDFRGEFGIVSGETVEEQALFTNEVIRWVLNFYQSSPSAYKPTSVMVIGHSLGGLVARLAPTLPNYIPNSIRTAITFASPHAETPLPFYPSIAHVYQSIDTKWNNHTNFAPGGSLSDMFVVSIGGGYRDHLVSSDKTELKSKAEGGECARFISEVSTSIPGVWRQVDHDAMVWCNELVSKVASLMYLLMSTHHEDSLTLCQRSHRASHFLTNHFLPSLSPTLSPTPSTTTQPTTKIQKKIELRGRQQLVVGVEEGGFGCGGEEGGEDLWILGGSPGTRVVKHEGEGTGVGGGWWKVKDGKRKTGGVDLTEQKIKLNDHEYAVMWRIPRSELCGFGSVIITDTNLVKVLFEKADLEVHNGKSLSLFSSFRLPWNSEVQMLEFSSYPSWLSLSLTFPAHQSGSFFYFFTPYRALSSSSSSLVSSPSLVQSETFLVTETKKSQQHTINLYSSSFLSLSSSSSFHSRLPTEDGHLTIVFLKSDNENEGMWRDGMEVGVSVSISSTIARAVLVSLPSSLAFGIALLIFRSHANFEFLPVFWELGTLCVMNLLFSSSSADPLHQLFMRTFLHSLIAYCIGSFVSHGFMILVHVLVMFSNTNFFSKIIPSYSTIPLTLALSILFLFLSFFVHGLFGVVFGFMLVLCGQPSKNLSPYSRFWCIKFCSLCLGVVVGLLMVTTLLTWIQDIRFLGFFSTFSFDIPTNFLKNCDQLFGGMFLLFCLQLRHFNIEKKEITAADSQAWFILYCLLGLASLLILSLYPFTLPCVSMVIMGCFSAEMVINAKQKTKKN